MASTLTPDELIADYKAYLTAFNAKSFTGIKEHLSPDCTVHFKGKQIAKSREDMLPTYPAHWKKWPTPVELLDIRPIESGVWTMLRDWDNRRDMEVEYFYNDMNLHIRHNIKEPVPFDDEALKEEVAAADSAIRKLDAE
jgi:hypothetical protein